MDDFQTYSVENVRAQVRKAPAGSSVYELRFYSENGRPSRVPTGIVERFFYYPSGGTIRDHDLNILFYEPKLDKYHPANREAEGAAG